MKCSYIISSTVLCFSLQASQNNPLYTYESLSEEDTLSLTDNFSFESKNKILFDSLYSQEDLNQMLSTSSESISICSDNIDNLKNNFLSSFIEQIKNNNDHLNLFTIENNFSALNDLLRKIIGKENIDISDQFIINQTHRRIINEYRKAVSKYYEFMSSNIVPWKNKSQISDEQVKNEKNEYTKNITFSFTAIIENSLQKFNDQVQNHYKNKTQTDYLRAIKIREELDLYLYQ